jgi:hypothetical protein
MLTLSNFGDLTDARITKIFERTFNDTPTMIPTLFDVRKSDREYEYDSSTGAIGDPVDLSSTGTVDYKDSYQGYDVQYTHNEYVNGMKIQRKLLDDARVNIQNRMSSNLAASMKRKREIDGASVLNNAFNSGYTGGDSLSLCNDAHTSNNPNGSNQDNAGSTAMSATSVEATRRLGFDMLDDAGNLALVHYDTLIVPRELEETAWEIINSTGKVDTADNNANFHKGKYKLVVWDFLTDSNNWFFVNWRLMKMYLVWYNRINTEFQRDVDFDSYSRKYSAYMRYSYGFSDWPWVYGHEVS